MKKLFSLTLSIAVSTMLWAQTTPVKKPQVKQAVKPATATSKPVAPAPQLKTLSDSASYAIGLSSALSGKQEGLPKLNAALLTRGINDIQLGKKPLFDDMTGYNLWIRFTTALKEEKENPAKPGTPVKKPAVKPVPATAVLKTTLDSLAYAIGMNRAMFAQQQGIKNINTALCSKGINDVQNGNKPAFDETVAYAVMNTYITQIQQEKSLPIIKEGEAFLEQNKTKPGVKTTESGLQYEVIKEGTGIKPTAIDTFVVNYRGTLINGTEFDASYNRNEPLTMAMKDVIRGWTEGLQLMAIGSKYKFYVPYAMAYGPYDNGAIPGGSMLIFDIEMVDVKKLAQP